MKKATSVTPVKIFALVVESPPVQKTTTRMIGAKIAVRLKTRAIDGLGTSRPPRVGRGEVLAAALLVFSLSTGFSMGISSPSSVSMTYSYS